MEDYAKYDSLSKEDKKQIEENLTKVSKALFAQMEELRKIQSKHESNEISLHVQDIVNEIHKVRIYISSKQWFLK